MSSTPPTFCATLLTSVPLFFSHPCTLLLPLATALFLLPRASLAPCSQAIPLFCYPWTPLAFQSLPWLSWFFPCFPCFPYLRSVAFLAVHALTLCALGLMHGSCWWCWFSSGELIFLDHTSYHKCWTRRANAQTTKDFSSPLARFHPRLMTSIT